MEQACSLLLCVYLLVHIPSLGAILITIIYNNMIKLVSGLDIKDTNHNIKNQVNLYR
jgi:hypothetical protein